MRPTDAIVSGSGMVSSSLSTYLPPSFHSLNWKRKRGIEGNSLLFPSLWLFLSPDDLINKCSVISSQLFTDAQKTEALGIVLLTESMWGGAFC